MIKNKNFIYIIVAFLIIIGSIITSMITYNNSKTKIIETYDQLLSMNDGIYQVRRDKTYFLLDTNLKQFDSSKNEFNVLYDRYYLKIIDKNYYLMRNKNKVAEFDGNPMMSNMQKTYKDSNDKSAKVLFLDGKKLFDDSFNSDYNTSNYYITKIANKYLVYDVNNGDILLTGDDVIMLLLANKFVGITTTSDGKNSIYLLSDNLKKNIALGDNSLYLSKNIEDVTKNGFSYIDIKNDTYFVAINKNKKYGIIDKNGKVIFDINYDFAIFNEKLNEVALQKNNLYSIYNINGTKIYDGYLWFIPYGNYNVLVKDNKVIVESDRKVITEFNGDISDYKIYLDKNNILYVGDSNSVTIIKNNNIKKYDKRQLLVDYNGATAILYERVSNDYHFYNSSNDEIGTINIPPNSATDIYLGLNKNPYKDGYYDIEINYLLEKKLDVSLDKRDVFSKSITIDIINNKVMDNNNLPGLISIGQSYYKINIDGVLTIYNNKLDLLLTVKNIDEIKVIDTNHMFAINSNRQAILIQIQ